MWRGRAQPKGAPAVMRIGEIFISHTHADRAIADALSAAIKSVFGDLLTTSYSTKDDQLLDQEGARRRHQAG